MPTSTVQFILFLFIAACVTLLIWGWIRIGVIEERKHEEAMARLRVLRELNQIELHRQGLIVDPAPNDPSTERKST